MIANDVQHYWQWQCQNRIFESPVGGLQVSTGASSLDHREAHDQLCNSDE